MKKLNAGLGVLLGGVLLLTLGAQDPTATLESPKVVVGTFDSRAIAVAYVRSDAFAARIRELRADLERAKAAGEEEIVAELEALGPAMQQRVHRQGFGTAPVDDIIAHVEDRLPGIAEQAGVDVIVSKWTLAYRSPTAKFVDLTDRLAAEFDPNEDTLKVIRELVATEPIPLDRLEDAHD